MIQIKYNMRHLRQDTDRIPVVIGPDFKFYLLDHHHLALSLLSVNKEKAQAEIIRNWSDDGLDMSSFWEKMKDNKWVYLKNSKGLDIQISDLPSRLQDMEDDPFRSLAWCVREKGGFEKEAQAYYIEFRWADFFRSRITDWQGDERGWQNAVAEALILAHSNDAKKLPGSTQGLKPPKNGDLDCDTWPLLNK